LEAGGEFFEDVLGFGDAGGADALGAARGDGGGGIAGEGALGGGEFLEFLLVEEEDFAVGFEVAAVGGDGGAEGGFVGGAGAEGERDGETVAGLGDVGGDVGDAEMGGVFLEVGRELGAEGVAQAGEVGGEEVEGLVAIAEPPRAVGGLEDEAVFFEEGEDGGVGRVFAGRQGDGEEVFAAVDAETRAGRAGRDARRGGRGGAGGGGGRCQENGDAGERAIVVPRDGGGAVDPEEDGLARERGEQIAEARAVELDDFRRGLGAGPALEEDEGGDEFGGGRTGGEIEVHLDRNGVARGGRGEVGREVEAEHGGYAVVRRARRSGPATRRGGRQP
jgi:hypothetical protein